MKQNMVDCRWFPCFLLFINSRFVGDPKHGFDICDLSSDPHFLLSVFRVYQGFVYRQFTDTACADPGIFVRGGGGVKVNLTKKKLRQRFLVN